MIDIDSFDEEEIRKRLQRQVMDGNIRVTIHGHEEMLNEDVSLDSMCEAIQKGRIIENYPEHKRGPCCLICGQTSSNQYLHVVCTTSLEVIIVITVYKPKTPQWDTPFQRGT